MGEPVVEPVTVQTHRRHGGHRMLGPLARLGSLLGLVGASLVVSILPAEAALPAAVDRAASCFDPVTVGAARAAGPDARGRPRDTASMPAAAVRRIDRQTSRLAAAKRASGSTARLAADGSIQVYFHVMLDRRGRGDVTATQIRRQMQVLNEDYAGGESTVAADTGFRFSLAGVNRFRNNVWHVDGASQTYRRKTRQGGSDALNIWLVAFRNGNLGQSTFPWSYAANPRLDGVRIQFSSLPGGRIVHYNEGKTATHETGHWLGLLHTFQGGCGVTNDGVDDTPAQSGPTQGCPSDSTDTCSLPGTDPIHNYMDYSYDSCYNQFTPGQSDEMHRAFLAYRTSS